MPRSLTAFLDETVPAGVTVATHCSDCGGALELAFELRPSRERTRPVVLTCPYCGGEAEMRTGRRLLWVAELIDDNDDAH